VTDDDSTHSTPRLLLCNSTRRTRRLCEVLTPPPRLWRHHLRTAEAIKCEPRDRAPHARGCLQVATLRHDTRTRREVGGLPFCIRRNESSSQHQVSQDKSEDKRTKNDTKPLRTLQCDCIRQVGRTALYSLLSRVPTLASTCTAPLASRYVVRYLAVFCNSTYGLTQAGRNVVATKLPK
jgi:hypothetical protein